MKKVLNIALIAHDARKADMVEWAKHNIEFLCHHNISCTGTTGGLILKMFMENGCDNVNVIRYESGPLGGDAQIAAEVVNGNVNLCVFLIDDLNPNPHEADIQMLIRQCRIHNVPIACNRHTADLLITSNLWDDKTYIPTKPKYVKFDKTQYL